tara:strand:+ start:5933 stop:6397 length:465 start_codon:yes stop_codon:yes gene_type:complete
MSSPYPLDIGIQALLVVAMGADIPVYKSDFVPSVDLKSTPNGYVFFSIGDIIPNHCSEGLAGPDTGETIGFELDVICIAHDNVQRKSLVTSVLAVLQPLVSGRRTQLTSYRINGTSYINYLRLESQRENSMLKEGQSTPDLTMLALTFSGKATC